MEILVNKVAESGIITINLEDYFPKEVVEFDIKPFLFMEMILKEKDFREALKNIDWNTFQNKTVAIVCSVDAIIPMWAYMLVANYLEGVAMKIIFQTEANAKTIALIDNINAIDTTPYFDKRVVIKGCGDITIPESAYVAITVKLKPVVKSIMYGEPCSTVPIYKRK